MKAIASSEYDTARQRFVQRADAEGLIDVVVERYDTPLGQITIAATTDGVVKIGLPNEQPDTVLDELANRISPRVLTASRASLERARVQLDEYFAGARTTFDVPLDLSLTTPFYRDALLATNRIPYGHTASYAQVAADTGRPPAIRPVATALARNPLPILIPCHRVICGDGRPGNYRGGATAKQFLLDLEQDR